jgi:hypothetical protein
LSHSNTRGIQLFKINLIWYILQYILNSVFSVMFYMMKWTKQEPTCINFKVFLDQFNLLYIWICLYFVIDEELWTHKLMDRIMSCNHSLDRKEILKFVYYFMNIFLTIYIFKYFLLLVPFSHQKSTITFSF